MNLVRSDEAVRGLGRYRAVMLPRTRLARLVLALSTAVGLATLAACGTTLSKSDSRGFAAPGAQDANLGGASGTTASTPASRDATAASTGQGTGLGATSPSAGNVQGASAAATGSASGTTDTRSSLPSGSLVAPQGPGVTATTVNVGLVYSSDAAAGDAAIGAAGASAGDTRTYYTAMANYLNAHGGLAGHRISILWFDVKTASAETVEQQEQSACAFWTQDHKVLALPGGNDILNACAEKAHAFAVGVGSEVSSTFQKYPHYVDPVSFRIDRLGPVTVNGLDSQKYFAGKLGLVTWDDPNYVFAMQHGYAPALAAKHIAYRDVAYIGVPQTLGAVSDMSAAVRSAIVKFQSEGIDHVIVQDGPAGVWAGTGLTFEWFNQAKSQHYYPRYGMNSYNSPGWSVLPADQQHGGLAVTWADNDPSYDAGWKVNQARVACFKIMNDAGVTVNGSNLNAEGVAAGACDIFSVMKLALDHAPNLTADGFIAGVNQLTRGFPSALVYGTHLSPTQHDGGDKVRNSYFDDACSCMKFTGAPYSPT